MIRPANQALQARPDQDVFPAARASHRMQDYAESPSRLQSVFNKVKITLVGNAIAHEWSAFPCLSGIQNTGGLCRLSAYPAITRSFMAVDPHHHFVDNI
jgi:hypothetical protein